MTKAQLLKLTEDLKACRPLALMAIDGVADGGTCNFDAPTLYGFKLTPKVLAAIEDAGLGAFEAKNHGIVLQIRVGGQGNTRTLAAETFQNALKARGYKSSMFYQMD
jgi:hypothetical protein